MDWADHVIVVNIVDHVLSEISDIQIPLEYRDQVSHLTMRINWAPAVWGVLHKFWWRIINVPPGAGNSGTVSHTPPAFVKYHCSGYKWTSADFRKLQGAGRKNWEMWEWKWLSLLTVSTLYLTNTDWQYYIGQTDWEDGMGAQDESLENSKQQPTLWQSRNTQSQPRCGQWGCSGLQWWSDW